MVLRARRFDSGSQGQIVTLNVLSKNLTSQMLLLR